MVAFKTYKLQYFWMLKIVLDSIIYIWDTQKYAFEIKTII